MLLNLFSILSPLGYLIIANTIAENTTIKNTIAPQLDDHDETALYGQCDPIYPFCFFSTGIPVDLPSRDQLQDVCRKEHGKSHLLEFSQLNSKVAFYDFMTRYSLDNVLLSAIIDERGKWSWKSGLKGQLRKIQPDIDFSIANGSLIYHLNKKNPSKFHVVCMTNCPIEWTIKRQTAEVEGEKDFKDDFQLRSCQKNCNLRAFCTGVFYDQTAVRNNYCGIFFSASTDRPEQTYYENNRATRDASRCLSGVQLKEKKLEEKDLLDNKELIDFVLEDAAHHFKNQFIFTLTAVLVVIIVTAIGILVYGGCSKR